MSEPTDRYQPERDSAPTPSGPAGPFANMSDRPSREGGFAGAAEGFVDRAADDPANRELPPRPTRFTPAVGALVLAVAVTSFVDDAGVIEVRWWLPFAVALALGGLAVAALTVRQMLIPTIGVTTSDRTPR